MKNVDMIVRNAEILTMDPDFSVFNPGAIAISGTSIEAVGQESDIMENYSAPTVIDGKGKIMLPGFVNAHTHVPMALLRGLADDLRLDVWLMGYMMPVEREFVSPDFVNLGTRLSCAEMIRSGVTSLPICITLKKRLPKQLLRLVCAQYARRQFSNFPPRIPNFLRNPSKCRAILFPAGRTTTSLFHRSRRIRHTPVLRKFYMLQQP